MTEKHNVEYKQSWHDDYLKWVCGFANAQGGFVSILQKAQKQIAVINEAKFNDRMLKAIEYVKEHGKITNGEYQKINDVSKATASRDLVKLTEEYNILERTGVTGVGTAYSLKGS
ncbi:TPA: hypothetical protein DCR49_09920 [Candidatus Delongbacteria bacterium]|nr:hypothetical protein [Candidatus Delongbacteria bacterium]